ncbi:MAG: type II toxin-antitoxin system RelE/ParE family toxin [Elusimicrobia bacterium]|nr:type II toxin-antitoxin system RelE/ParE family toxin [Elusimicrobiota bacterium]
MEFIETGVFTRRIIELLSDDSYLKLQSMLVENPKAGKIIPGTGGLRKVRWRAAGRGKRGGLRIIYYYVSADRLYMIFAYDKTEHGDLTPEQLKRLRAYLKGGVL